MKKIIIICFSLLRLTAVSQDDNNTSKKDQNYDLFVSGGVHLAVWHLITNTSISNKSIPYNIHIDKVFMHKHAFGVGYSEDKFKYDPTKIFGSYPEAVRQNFRIRYYKYMMDYEKPVSIYMGLSTGFSIWTSDYSRQNTYWPTAQFLFGVKIKFNDTFFLQTELGAGAPYALQTSLGLKF